MGNNAAQTRLQGLTSLKPAHGHTVLIADDQHTIVVLLRDVLEDAGYSVVTAQDGQTALTLALDMQPDLILADVMMPQLDGVTLLKRLRAHAATARVPVVLMTASSPPQVDDRFVTVLVKPFDIDVLLEQVRHYLGCS